MSLRVGLVVPHIFMQDDILPDVIFSPGGLALELCDELLAQNVAVTLFSPGAVTTKANNITADLSGFKTELDLRGDTYLDLLKKHPLTFITLARQVQAELIARAYQMANEDLLDIIHVYTNEEDIAFPFAQFCKKPVVFTHHDPFNFLAGYRANFPKYKKLNWLSISDDQRKTMPKDTNWRATVYNALSEKEWPEQSIEKEAYVAYFGRIIEPKATHLAIKAVQKYNQTAAQPLKLKLAGKHYSDEQKKSYWDTTIRPLLEDPNIEFVGFVKGNQAKQQFLSRAKALIVPSTFNEPFGMVMIEALACSTPLIGLNSGAIPEVIQDGKTGFLVEKSEDETTTIQGLAHALEKVEVINPQTCRQDFLDRFTMKQMASQHKEIYKKLVK